MNSFDSKGYLQKSADESYSSAKSFDVTQLPRAPAKGSALEAAGAIFRQENIIVSAINDKRAQFDRFSENDPNFKFWEHIPPGHAKYAAAYSDAKNLDMVRDKFFQIENEHRDRELYADKPLESFFVGFIASNADPTALFPGTLFYKNFRAQLSTAKRAIGAGGAMGLQASAQEYALRGSQGIRSDEESANNILAATVLGASLGALSGTFLNSKEGKTATEQTAQIFQDGNITPPGTGPLPDGAPKPKRPGGGEALVDIADADYPFSGNFLPPPKPKGLPAPTTGEKKTTYATDGLFHGTARELENLENIGERQSPGELTSGSVITATSSNPSQLTQVNTSIYGNGFYTTNDVSVAKGYTKKGARQAEIAGVKNPTVYKIEEKYPIKLKDIDAPIKGDSDFESIINEISKSSSGWLKTAFDRAKAEETFSKFIDTIRNVGVENQVKSQEFQDFLTNKILMPLSENGYRGFTHIGGRLTKRKKKHNVNIYWYPRDDLNIYKHISAGGAGGNIPPIETSAGFISPSGKSVGAANVMESALQGQALKMAESTANLLGRTIGKITPSARLATNRLGYMRLAGESIFENNWRYKKNYSIRDEEGQERGWKPNQIALETRIKVDLGKVTSLLMKIDDIYFKQAGIERGESFKVEKDFFVGKGLDRDEFSDALFFDIVEGFIDPRPGVGEAARLMHEFWEEWKEKYTELGVYPEGMTVRNSVNYFTHYYNVPWIQDPRNRPQAEQILTDHFKYVNSLVEANIEEIRAYLKELKAIQKEYKKNKNPELKEQIDKFKANFRERMPEEIFDANWKPRSFVMDDDQIWVSAQNTLDNIMNLNESRFSNQYLGKLGIGNNPRPTNHRTLLIPTEQIAPMLMRDYRKVIPKFARSMIPNYHITKFAQDMGFTEVDADVNVSGAPGQVLGGFMALAKEELDNRLFKLSPEQTDRLYEAFRDGQADIKAGLELLMGTFGNGFNTNDNSFAKFSKIMAAYNYTKMMGYMVVSSIPDMGMIVLRNGYAAMIHEGIIPIMNQLKSAKHNKQFMQSLGKSVETFTGFRLKAYADQDDLVGSPGKLTKAFDYLITRYGNMSLMSPWTDLMQWITGNAYLGDLLNSTIGYKKNIDELENLQKERDRLKSQAIPNEDAIRAIEIEMANMQPLPDATRSKYLALGIEDKHFKILHEQWSKIGGIDDGVFWIDWGAWDMSTKENIDALGVFQAALVKEIDSTIIVPGAGDKPLFMHNPIGHLMLQFKSFQFASTNKILISGMTHSDGNFYNGITLMLFLGALSYITSSLLKNKEIDGDIRNMAFEAIDRSGLIGILMEVPLIAQKMGFLPGMGTSRYQSRDWIGAAGGPTLGTLSDWVNLANKVKNAGEEPLTVKDFNKGVRQFPTNNIWYIDGLNRNLGITDEIARSFGFEENK